MSVRESVRMAPGDAPVRVAAGIVDVFLVRDNASDLPLASVAAGGIIVAATATSMRVVPRIDTHIERVEQIDGQPIDGGSISAEGLSAFTGPLAGNLGGDWGDAIAAATAADLPAVLGTVLPAYAGRVHQERLHRSALSVEQDEHVIRGAYRRAREDIVTPGRALPVESTDELTAALRILGRIQGFTVVSPMIVAGVEPPADPAERLPSLAHASGVRFRPVRLTGAWQQVRSRPFLAFTRGDDGDPQPVALVPTARGYVIRRPGGDGDERLTPALVDTLDPTAFEVYPPLARDRGVTWRDVARLGMRRTSGEWAWTLAMALGIALLGLLTPILTQWVLSSIVPEGRTGLLVQVGAALALAAFVAGAFSMVQYFAISRLAQRATEHVQPAFWDRVLSMPPSFFRRFSAGDLSVRILAVDALQQLVNVEVVSAVLIGVLSLVNLVLMFRLDTALGLMGLVVLVLTIGVLMLCVRSMQSLYTQSIEAQLRGTSWVVQLLTGIGKVRLANAETRMQSTYLDLVRQQVVALARMTSVVGRAQAWIVFITAAAPAAFFVLIGTQWNEASGPTITPAVFLAFYTAFLTAFGAIAGMMAILTSVASAGPIFKLLAPIMESLPEAATHRADPGRLDGDIELRNVSFRYGPDSPIVLDRLSFHVKAGEMVALVGPSGSGKSSSLRMLLGFDEPSDGQILFDGRDLHDLDLDLVRRQMGVVVQNGQITRGPILKNILGGVNGDENAAWEAAAAAALDEDIRAMPMRMHTIVDPQLLSGGQAQRILLARALVRKPSIVVLDEATSALDNESQAKVTEALDRLGATRIVVAHRLSTIRAADRILVIVGGKVVEEGSYDELMALDGAFAELARRQVA